MSKLMELLSTNSSIGTSEGSSDTLEIKISSDFSSHHRDEKITCNLTLNRKLKERILKKVICCGQTP